MKLVQTYKQNKMQFDNREEKKKNFADFAVNVTRQVLLIQHKARHSNASIENILQYSHVFH